MEIKVGATRALLPLSTVLVATVVLGQKSPIAGGVIPASAHIVSNSNGFGKGGADIHSKPMRHAIPDICQNVVELPP